MNSSFSKRKCSISGMLCKKVVEVTIVCMKVNQLDLRILRRNRHLTKKRLICVKRDVIEAPLVFKIYILFVKEK